MGETNKGEQGQNFSDFEKSLDLLLSLVNGGIFIDNAKEDTLKTEIVKGFEANEPLILTKENFSLVRKLLEVTQQTFGGCGLDFPYPLKKLTEVQKKVEQLFLNFLHERMSETVAAAQWELKRKNDSVVFHCYTVVPSEKTKGVEKEFLISPNMEIVKVFEKEVPLYSNKSK